MTNLVEQGVEAGTWNKYGSRNPIQRWLVRRFLSSLASIAHPCVSSCAGALDVGCGEGVTTSLFKSVGFTRIRGVDFSVGILDVARTVNPGINFEQANIYDINPGLHSEDFISACEVLEHLDDPERGLRRLAACSRRFCVMSVPREPLFRGMNFCAGKYWSRFGNSPGHLNHWSSTEFCRFVSTAFEITEVRHPLPWTIVLAKPKK